MRRIFYLRPHSQALQIRGQNLKHGPTRNKRCGPQRNLELIACAIIIPADLLWACRDIKPIQGGDLGRVEVVEGSVDVPAVITSRSLGFVLIRDMCFVERLVMWVLKFRFRKAFVIINSSVTNQLNLGNARDGFKIRMKDGLRSLSGLIITVAVVLRGRVKCLVCTNE